MGMKIENELLLKYTKENLEFLNRIENANTEAARICYELLNSINFQYKVVFSAGMNYIYSNNFFDKADTQSLLGDAEFRKHIAVGSYLSNIVSVLENFLAEFMIEKIHDENIRSIEDLYKFIKSKYDSKFNYKYHVSFQNLEVVNRYFKDFLNKKINKSQIETMNKLVYDNRHLFVHSLQKEGNQINLFDGKAIEICKITIVYFVDYIDKL